MWPLKQIFPRMFSCQRKLNALVRLSNNKKVNLSSKYSNIFVRFLWIFEYICDIRNQYSYSNIRYSAEIIRIFKYIGIFFTPCCAGSTMKEYTVFYLYLFNKLNKSTLWCKLIIRYKPISIWYRFSTKLNWEKV